MPSQQLQSNPTDSTSSSTAPNVLPTLPPNVVGCNLVVTERNGISHRTESPDDSDLHLSQENHDSEKSASSSLTRPYCAHLACWIRSVPTEILIQIFLQCLDTNRRSPPWYLSHVCRFWREIALRTSQLWRRVPLPALSNRIDRAKALVAFLPEYLARSKDQTIVFDWEGNWDPNSLEEEDEFEDPICGQSDIILDLLIQHAERWGSVSIISQRWTPKLEYQLVQLQERLPRLYYLELASNSVQVMYIESFRTAQQLKEVKLCTPIDANNSDLIHDFIDWNPLRRLKLIIPSSTVLPNMSLWRHLVELDLEYFGSDIAAFVSEKVELPNLKSLSYRSPSDLSSDHFDLLSIPLLTDFRVFSILAEPEPFGSFLRFLNRHSNSLQRLTIGHVHFMYFRTSRPETRINFTSLPFARLNNLGYLQLHHPPLDKLSEFLKAIGSGTLPFSFQCLCIVFNNSTRLSDAYVREVSDQLRTVVLWSEGVNQDSPLRRIDINIGKLNDYLAFLIALEGWPEEFTGDLIQPFVSLCKCQKILHEVYPFTYSNEGTVIVTKFDEEKTQKIGNCLGFMEIDIEQVQLLYCTRLHFIVRALSKLSPDQFTPTRNDIPERASALVNQWKTLFEKDAPNRRWMHLGSRKLIYVPGNDDLYRPNIEHWMYGLGREWEKDSEDVEDLF